MALNPGALRTRPISLHYLHDLRALEAVARHPSCRRAAQERA